MVPEDKSKTPADAREDAGAASPPPAGMSRPPRHPLTALRSQMDHLFENFFDDWSLPQWAGASGDRLFPRMDMSEDEKNVVVELDLPGLEEKDIELSFHDGVLTVKAERKSEAEKGGDDKSFHRVERSYGMTQRTIRVPCAVDEDGIAAEFAKGVLTVTLPKTEPAPPKSKRIAIRSG